MGTKSKEDRMLEVAKKNVNASALAGLSTEVVIWLAELRVHAAYAEIGKVNVVKKLRQIKAWCIESRMNWEQFADEHLPLGRRMLDLYLNTLKTVGEYAYKEFITITTVDEQRRAHRLLTSGDIRHEDGEIVIRRQRIPNDPAHALEIVEAIREATARAEAAEARGKEKEEQLTRHKEASERRESKLHELLEAKDKRIAHYEMTPDSTALGTEADARFWAHLKDWQKEMELRFLQVDTLLGAEGHSAGFWYELGTLIGWMQEELHQRGMALLRTRGGAFMEFARLERRPEVQVPPGRWPERTVTARAERVLAEAEARGVTNGHGEAYPLPVGQAGTADTPIIEL